MLRTYSVLTHYQTRIYYTILSLLSPSSYLHCYLQFVLPLHPHPTHRNTAIPHQLHDGTDDLNLDAIICTNGGFAEDCSTDPSSTHLQMMQVNYHPVIAAASLLPEYITKRQGLFCTIGATAALAPSAPNFTSFSFQIGE